MSGRERDTLVARVHRGPARAEAIWALGELADPKLAPTLVAALRAAVADGDTDAVWQGIVALQDLDELPRRDGAIDEIERNLADARAFLAERGDEDVVALADTHPLHRAARIGDLEAVLRLSDAATVDARDPDGWTPLLHAAYGDHVEVVRALLARGADPDLAADGTRPLDFALRGDAARPLLEALLDGGATLDGRHFPEVYLAARWPELLSALLERGVDPDAATTEGETALSFACSWGLLDSVEILLAGGADPNRVVRDGALDWPPLFYAVEAGHAEVVERLLAAGADAAHLTPRGRTALGVALDHRRVDLARRLPERAPVLLDLERWSAPAGPLRGRLLATVAADGVDVDVELWNTGDGAVPVTIDDPHALIWRLTRDGVEVAPLSHRLDVISSPRARERAAGQPARWRASLRSPGRVDLVTCTWALDGPALLSATWTGGLDLPPAPLDC